MGEPGREVYRFDGYWYEDTEAGKHELLEVLQDAIQSHVWSTENDEAYPTRKSREEAVSASFDSTSCDMPFWDNIKAIMRDAPCELDVTRWRKDG